MIYFTQAMVKLLEISLTKYNLLIIVMFFKLKFSLPPVKDNLV